MADCLNIADQVNNGRLDDDEIEDIFADLNNRKQRAQASDDMESVESALLREGEIIASQAEEAALIERRNRLKNIVIENKLLDLMNRADQMTDNPALGLEAAISGVNAPFEGAQRSVDAITNGLMNSYAGGLIHDLKKANLHTQYNKMSGDFEREVANALGDLNRREPRGVNVSREAMEIAKIMQKYQVTSVRRLNREGGHIREKSGRVVRQSHDPAKMAVTGEKEWKDAVRQKLDYEAMGVRPEQIEKFLSETYISLKTGIRLDKDVSDIERAFKGPGNLAKKDAAARVLEFKTVDDWFDYDRQFGTGSLREAFHQDLNRNARSTAIISNFGTNPQAMLERVVKIAREKYRGNEAKLEKFELEAGKGVPRYIQNRMDEVTGDINLGAGTTVARISSLIRAVQTMAKLGGAVISAGSDIAFTATNRIYQGRSLGDAWQDAFTASIEGLQGGEKREFADLLGAGLEGQLGDFMSRANASDDLPGATSRAMAFFFKMNLLGPWSDANKRGVTFMISRDFAMNAGKTINELPEDMQRLLRIYGIDEAQWNVIRQSTREAEDGRSYIMPGDIRQLEGSGVNQRVLDAASDNFFTLMSAEADFAVPSAGARERAILRQGYRPGTVAGEAIRFATQFKSFGITGLTKVVGRQVYGTGSRTFREQLGKGIGANAGLANAIVGTTVLGYFVMQTKEILKGREPREMSAETFVAALLQGGGLGIYGDFLFGEANRFGGGTLDTLAGPTIGTATEAIDLLQRARGIVTGAEDDISGDLLRLVKSNTPFANLFYAKSAMDYLVWFQLQETINPGYLRRAEKRIRRENHQEYWLPPSSIVATGGGFR